MRTSRFLSFAAIPILLLGIGFFVNSTGTIPSTQAVTRVTDPCLIDPTLCESSSSGGLTSGGFTSSGEAGGYCGDGYCDPYSESSASCYTDCPVGSSSGTGGYCGDGLCDSRSESSLNCSTDCGRTTTTYGAYYCDTSSYQCLAQRCTLGTANCYTDAGSCSSACQAPTRYGYSCDTSSYQCQLCTLGSSGCIYSDSTSCQSACQAPEVGYWYSCNTSTYQCQTCTRGTLGCTYTDVRSCQSACQSSSTISISGPNPASGISGSRIEITSSNNGFTATGNTVHMRNTSTNITTDIPNLTASSTLGQENQSFIADVTGLLKNIFQIDDSVAAITGGYNTLDFNLPAGLSAGVYTLTVTNGIGQSSINPPLQFTLTAAPVDTTPPTVSANPPGSNSNSTINVILTASDTGGSGIAEARYMIDAPASSTTGFSFTGSTTVTITKSGTGTSETHYLSVWSRDNANNIAPVGTFYYTINSPVALPPASTCSFNPADAATVQKGLVLEWMRLCGPSFKNYLTANAINDANFSLSDPFDTMIQKLSLPTLNVWQQTYVSGNIRQGLREKMQNYACQLRNKGVAFSTLTDNYHLGGLPFMVSDTCSGATVLDTTKPQVLVTVGTFNAISGVFPVTLVPADNDRIVDASYNLNTDALETTVASQHFTTTKLVNTPPSTTVHWWVKDASGNTNTGLTVLPGINTNINGVIGFQPVNTNPGGGLHCVLAHTGLPCPPPPVCQPNEYCSDRACPPPQPPTIQCTNDPLGFGGL